MKLATEYCKTARRVLRHAVIVRRGSNLTGRSEESLKPPELFETEQEESN